MIEIDGKVYRNVQEQVKKNMDDIEDLDERVEALEEAPGQTYTAGAGISIANNVISVDEDVAMKTDLDYNNLSNKPDLTEYAKLNDDTQTITAASVTTTPGAGYIHTTYGPTSISMSIPRTPGYTLNIPTKDGTLATTNDLPTYTGGSGISISGNTISVDTNKVQTFSGSYENTLKLNITSGEIKTFLDSLPMLYGGFSDPNTRITLDEENENGNKCFVQGSFLLHNVSANTYTIVSTDPIDMTQYANSNYSLNPKKYIAQKAYSSIITFKNAKIFYYWSSSSLYTYNGNPITLKFVSLNKGERDQECSIVDGYKISTADRLVRELPEFDFATLNSSVQPGSVWFQLKLPTTAGNYVLKVTVKSNGLPSYSWVAES